MKRVLVLGLSPSAKGGSSQSLKRLNMWMDHLGIHHYSFANLYPDGVNKLQHLEILKLAEDKLIICLGSKVASAVYTYYCQYPEFKAKWVAIDHPSPLNRKLNDSRYVSVMLKEAATAIRIFA